MELFQYQQKETVWTSFENLKGEPHMGGLENHGAKGHPFEYFANGEEKVLCDLEGPAVLRRIWFTLSDRSEKSLSGIYLCAYWDGEEEPSVCVPIGDFFCMGNGKMVPFENEFFASPEGRSFVCTIPMPFRKRGKVTLRNLSGMDNSHLFFDTALTREELPEDVLYFHTKCLERKRNKLAEDVEILPEIRGKGRFLGMNVALQIDPACQDSWWGEGEVKIYLNGEKTPSLAGTGAEDYLGTAWGLGAFCGRWHGCSSIDEAQASFYRFHGKDPIFFENGCKVTLQAIGGAGKAQAKKLAEQGAEMIPVACDLNGHMTHLYRKDWSWDDIPEEGFISFYRRDTFTTVAYYYLQHDAGDC